MFMFLILGVLDFQFVILKSLNRAFVTVLKYLKLLKKNYIIFVVSQYQNHQQLIKTNN